jgi:cytochrome c-type biogenesis protein CcmH
MRRLALVLFLAFLLTGGAAFSQGGTPPEPMAADPLKLLGPPLGQPVAAAELDACTKATAALLRCPVCQGLSVNDSPAPLAVKMRGQVRELRAQGYTEEQVLAYFEKSYGQFVRLEPPLTGINWLVWLAPVLALAIGGALVLRVLARGAASAPAAASVPADPELEAYLERARALAQETSAKEDQ